MTPRLAIVLALACLSLGATRYYSCGPRRVAPSAASSGPVYPESLLVWYPMLSADTLTNDASGNGRTATVSNGVLVAVADGADFTNKPYLTLPQSCVVSNNGTIAMRFYPRFLGANDMYYTLSAGTSDKVLMQTGAAILDTIGTGWRIQTGATPSNTWYDYIATWSTNAGVGARIYCASNNGAITLIGEDTAITDHGSPTLFRVGDWRTLAYPIDGIIRDFRVYNRRMDGTEATNIILDMRP